MIYILAVVTVAKLFLNKKKEDLLSFCLLFFCSSSALKYDFAKHNLECSFSDDKLDADTYPQDTAWCFSQDNEILECEVLPCWG